MQGYGWNFYDPRVGGTQVIHDADLGIDLTTEFIKSNDGKSWAVKVTGEMRPEAAAQSPLTSLVFHVAREGPFDQQTNWMVCNDLTSASGQAFPGAAACRGTNPKLGPFDISVIADQDKQNVQETVIRSLNVTEDKIWQAKSVLSEQLKSGDTTSEPGIGNIHFIRLDFGGSFTATFEYHEHASMRIDLGTMGDTLNHFYASFPSAVNKSFPLAAPFDQDKGYSNFTSSLISNLVGGLGFFYGDWKVDLSNAPEYQETDLGFWDAEAKAMGSAPITTAEPASLLSFTPSRPFFPRGFLWDEGFHILPVIEWDFDLAVVVLLSWLRLMDENGWVGREQILGPEARSRVPKEFQTQYPHHANPPTFIAMVLPALLSKVENPSSYHGRRSSYISSPRLIEKLYTPLAKHYNWFRRTQAGNFSSIYPRPSDSKDNEGYRWRGRTPEHCLGSGLDDYPRADPPHPGELHVDALSWVGASASSLRRAAEYLGRDGDVAAYTKQLDDIQHNLDALHWSDAEGFYCDATVNAAGKFEQACHLGYVSILPLLLGLTDLTHPNLDALLNSLSAEDLWSPHGIRSLAASHPGYRADEDYWRGAVWMNMNALAVLSLHRLATAGNQTTAREQDQAATEALRDKASRLGGQLRDRVVGTVYTSWADTGFVWEQYDDQTGEGRRSRAFTGWSACVLLLVGLEFPGYTSEEGWEDAADDQAQKTSFRTGIVVAFMTVLVVMILARRGLMRCLAPAWAQSWHLYRSGGEGGRYEEVIDLDSREGHLDDVDRGTSG